MIDLGFVLNDGGADDEYKYAASCTTHLVELEDAYNKVNREYKKAECPFTNPLYQVRKVIGNMIVNTMEGLTEYTFLTNNKC